jgi:hypothetical protein
MGSRVDLAGKQFGKLLAKMYVPGARKRGGRRGGMGRWICDCDCGTPDCLIAVNNLRSGHTLSCGCVQRQRSAVACRKRAVELTDRVFGRLTVVRFSDKTACDGKPLWECRCECGKTTYVRTANLTRGITRSCGCYAAERAALGNRTHGMARTPENNAWRAARTRCLSKNSRRYPNYAGLGIRMCFRYANSFLEFFADLGNKPEPTDSLDRRDPRGHYSCGRCTECNREGWPANCRWASDKRQGRNKKNTVLVTMDGQTKPLADWCEQFRRPYQLVYNRIRNLKWTPRQALLSPGRQELQLGGMLSGYELSMGAIRAERRAIVESTNFDLCHGG